jgi:hypothetical protein
VIISATIPVHISIFSRSSERGRRKTLRSTWPPRQQFSAWLSGTPLCSNRMFFDLIAPILVIFSSKGAFLKQLQRNIKHSDLLFRRKAWHAIAVSA